MPCARGSSAFEHYGQGYFLLETIKIAFFLKKKKKKKKADHSNDTADPGTSCECAAITLNQSNLCTTLLKG